MGLRNRITPRMLVLGLLLTAFLALVGSYGTWLYVSIYRKQARQAEEAREKAAVDGKYEKLLRQFYMPQDRGSYGDLRDYGFYTGSSYGNYSNLPSGYWVYAYPYWHIWEKSNGPDTPQNSQMYVTGLTVMPGPPPQALPPEEALKKARVDGKYQMLLRQIEVPSDYRSGEQYDYGYWTANSYGGHDDLPLGYWVYVHPHWYICATWLPRRGANVREAPSKRPARPTRTRPAISRPCGPPRRRTPRRNGCFWNTPSPSRRPPLSSTSRTPRGPWCGSPRLARTARKWTCGPARTR